MKQETGVTVSIKKRLDYDFILKKKIICFKKQENNFIHSHIQNSEYKLLYILKMNGNTLIFLWLNCSGKTIGQFYRALYAQLIFRRSSSQKHLRISSISPKDLSKALDIQIFYQTSFYDIAEEKKNHFTSTLIGSWLILL